MMSSTSSSSSSNLTDGTSVVRNKILDNMLRSHLSFKNTNPFIPQQYIKSDTIKRRAKFASSFQVRNTDNPTLANPSQTTESRLMLGNASMESSRGDSNALVTSPTDTRFNERGSKADAQARLGSSTAVALQTNANKILTKVPQPKWHSPWELSAVVAGHLGWVRSIAFDPSNEWFATGSSDRTIKIWDLAKCCAGVEGGLKLTLTGHLNAIRGLAVSSRHPYLFSVSEDKQVNCWDLEYNKIIRHYHGHLSAVFCVTMHPTLDLLITGGRDSVARVWDIRTKHQIHVLAGHTDAVSNVLAYSVDPQIVTASHDSTVKLWDLAAGRAMSTLTQHKKAVRGLCASPTEMSFASASADNIKKWQTRDGRFLKNFTGHNSVVNCLAANEDGVMVSGGDNGSLQFWDYESGYSFQSTKTIVQPGSLDAEAGIFAMVFDLSGSRLLTCEADKTIKIWRENPDASEDSHPIDMKTWTKQCLQLKRY